MGCGASSSVKEHPRRFKPIPDRFRNIAEVQAAIREAGLESSNLILGVDFTKSNTWTGKETFGGKCLHDCAGPRKNLYQQVIDVLGRTLEEFDDDKLIPAFGFGDSTTGDRKCFPFNVGGKPSHGVNEVLERYTEIAGSVKLAGPTSFAPVIREAIRIVQEEQSYHILVIIADGQVTVNSPEGDTAQAIIEASQYPLSIVTVGVGDGPWQAMERYDDELPARNFDNFQFVDYNAVLRSISSGCSHASSPLRGVPRPTQRDAASLALYEARFALAALMEIPDQYQFIKEAGLLSNIPRSTQRGSISLAACPVPARSRRRSHPRVVQVVPVAAPTAPFPAAREESCRFVSPSPSPNENAVPCIPPPSYEASAGSYEAWSAAPAAAW